MEEVIRLSVELFFAAVGALLSIYVIPWLKEKRIYEAVRVAVLAAEKLWETGAIEKRDKKELCLEYLKEKGIIITEEIHFMIEAAVKEADEMKSRFIKEG